MKIEINEKMIKNILTLRYDPTLETKKKKLSVEDFQPRKNSNYLENLTIPVVSNLHTTSHLADNFIVSISSPSSAINPLK